MKKMMNLKKSVLVSILCTIVLVASCGGEKKSSRDQQLELNDSDTTLFSDSDNNHDVDLMDTQDSDYDIYLNDNDNVINSENDDPGGEQDVIYDDNDKIKKNVKFSILHDINTTKLVWDTPRCIPLSKHLFCIDRKDNALWKIGNEGAEFLEFYPDLYGNWGATSVIMKDDGETIFFFSNNILWKSNGTRTGTYPVLEKELSLTNISGKSIFFIENMELWKYDTESEELIKLEDLPETDGYYDFIKVIGDNSNIYLALSMSDPDSFELFKSNGLPNSLNIVKSVDINNSIAFFKNNYYFSSKNTILKTDGISGKVETIYDSEITTIVDFIDAGNNLYFTKFSGLTSTTSLYKSDGTSNGTEFIYKNILTPVFANHSMYFGSTNKENITTLMKYDEKLNKLITLQTFDQFNFLKEIALIDNVLYFTINEEKNLWQDDNNVVQPVLFENKSVFCKNSDVFQYSDNKNVYGIVDGTKIVKIETDSNAEAIGDVDLEQSSMFNISDNSLYYIDKTRKIKKIDTKTKEVKEVAASKPDNVSSYPEFVSQIDNKISFRTSLSDSVNTLFTTEGSPETLLPVDILSDENPGITTIYKSDTALFYSTCFADSDFYSYKIIKRNDDDGKSEIIFLNEGENYDEITCDNLVTVFLKPPNTEILLFTPINAKNEKVELWRTDGTKDGTYPILEGIEPDLLWFCNFFAETVTLNNVWYYFASISLPDKKSVQKIFRTDGTKEGTYSLAEFDIEYFTLLQVFNGKVYFSGKNSSNENVLLETDGTIDGTKAFTNKLNKVEDMEIWKDRLFVADEQGIWETDGTDEGTKLYFSEPGVQIIYGLNNYLISKVVYYNESQVLKAYINNNGKINSTLIAGGGAYLVGEVKNNLIVAVENGCYPNSQIQLFTYDGTFSKEILHITTPSPSVYFSIYKINEEYLISFKGGLFLTDGTKEGSYELVDNESKVVPYSFFGTIGNKIIFSGSSAEYGEELFVYEKPEKK